MAADSTPIDDAAPPGKNAAGGFRGFAALFLLFLLVVSDVFTNSVVANFSGAVSGRHPTPFGYAVQGVCLVLLYAAFLYLADRGVF